MKTAGKVSQIPYTLTRRRSSKNIVLRVNDLGHVEVSAPFLVPKATIEEFILANEEKLLTRIAERKERHHTYTDGDRFLYEGRYVELSVAHGSRYNIVEEAGVLRVTTIEEECPPKVVEALVLWLYRKRTRQRVKEILPIWAMKLGLATPPFSVRDSKKRWASCSSKGRLNFSLRCQALCDEQLSYLVLHELAHLIHFDHSPDFHALVKQHMSSYKSVQRSLYAVQEESQLT
jgi:predicted metal-dependent hydrolase